MRPKVGRRLLILMSATLFMMATIFVSSLPSGATILEPELFITRRPDRFDFFNRRRTGRQRRCEPKENIVFLKTHKCASSTIQNILMRYGESRNLTFALPLDGNYFGYPMLFNKSMVLPLNVPNHNFNIISHHMRFNKTSVEEIMPKDSVYVTILRDPVDLFESLFSYFELKNFYGVDLTKLSNKSDKWIDSFSRYKHKIGRNQMSFDFGLDPEDFNNYTSVQNLAAMIKERFDLVMITERFDESLILLKDLMCWSTQDVVYFSHNARTEEHKLNLSAQTRNNLRVRNQADQMLYDTFLQEFSHKVDAFGQEKLAREVRKLNLLRNKWFNICVDKMAAPIEIGQKYKFWSPMVLGYRLRENSHNKTCEMLAKPELTFTEEIKYRQTNSSTTEHI